MGCHCLTHPHTHTHTHTPQEVTMASFNDEMFLCGSENLHVSGKFFFWIFVTCGLDSISFTLFTWSLCVFLLNVDVIHRSKRLFVKPPQTLRFHLELVVGIFTDFWLFMDIIKKESTDYSIKKIIEACGTKLWNSVCIVSGWCWGTLLPGADQQVRFIHLIIDHIN